MASKRVKTTAAELRLDVSKLKGDGAKAVRISKQTARSVEAAYHKEYNRTYLRGRGQAAEARYRSQRGMARSPAGRSGSMAAAGTRQSRIGGGFGGGIGSMAAGAAAFGGAYGLQAEMKNAKAFEETLVDLAVRGGKSKRWLSDLRNTIVATSNEYGIGKDQIAEYTSVIIDQTGNTELATKTLRGMTAVAYSANVPMGQLAGTVVEMQSKLALKPKQFTEALGILAAQADKGKVPLSKMASFLPEVLNATVQFGHTGVQALRDYGAVLQMAARGAGTLAEANTSMNRMLDQTAAKRGKIEKSLGIKLKKNGAWLQLGPMLKEIVGGLLKMKAAGKDVEKFIIKTWGIRGKKAILPLMQQGALGWDKKVGSSGGQGGLTSFDALRAAGGAGTISERVKRKRGLAPELDKWNKSVEQFKNSVYQHAIPALSKLGKLMPDLAKGAVFLLDNWKLLLAIWGGAKMSAFLANFINAGRSAGGVGGGAGGAGGGYYGGGGGQGGRRGRRARGAGRGALMALPLIPAAVGAGEHLGAWMAGSSVKEQKERHRNDAIMKAQREMYGTGGKVSPRAAWASTAAGRGTSEFLSGSGKHIKSQIDAFLQKTDTGTGNGYQFNPSSMAGMTLKQKKEALDRLKGLRGTVFDVQRKGMEEYGIPSQGPLAPSAGKTKDIAREGAPVLAVLATAINGLRAEIQKGIKARVIDPAKTPGGVTENRRGKKK